MPNPEEAIRETLDAIGKAVYRTGCVCDTDLCPHWRQAGESILRTLVERAQPQWRDIASAPKDGTWFLAIGLTWSLPSIVQWSYLSNCWQDMDQQVYPVHWMPLPPAPGDKSEEG